MKFRPFALLVLFAVLLLNSCQDKQEQIIPDSPYIVSTLAGSNEGNSNGTGAAAKFSYPKGIAVDVNGNVYVTDSFNSRICKITPGGVVTTFAGSLQGNEDGRGIAAKFSRPTAITIDQFGNLYVTDEVNRNIRKITSDGNVTTIAGSTKYYGSNDGPVAEATFGGPVSIVVDSQGALYVADSGGSGNLIRVITTTGKVTTLAGQINPSPYIPVDGIGSSAIFGTFGHLALDGNNNVIVIDMSMGIRKVSPDGKVTTISGTGHDYKNGALASAEFQAARGIAIDKSGAMFITEGYQYVGSSSNAPQSFDAHIRMVSAAGMVQTVAGGEHGFKDGDGNDAQFFAPNGIAVAADGTIYIADELNHAIRKLVPK